MKFIFIICSLVFLSACSKSVDIPKEEFGILLRMGEIQASISGPASLEKAFLIESVLLIRKNQKIELNNGQYVIEYEVLDPEQYYKMVAGNRTILHVVEKGIVNRALTGKPIHSKSDLYEIIESLKFPIKVVKIPNPAFERDAAEARRPSTLR